MRIFPYLYLIREVCFNGVKHNCNHHFLISAIAHISSNPLNCNIPHSSDPNFSHLSIPPIPIFLPLFLPCSNSSLSPHSSHLTFFLSPQLSHSPIPPIPQLSDHPFIPFPIPSIPSFLLLFLPSPNSSHLPIFPNTHSSHPPIPHMSQFSHPLIYPIPNSSPLYSSILPSSQASYVSQSTQLSFLPLFLHSSHN